MRLNMDRLALIKQAIRDVPDFPKKGILFKDITPVLKDGELFSMVLELFSEKIAKRQVDLIAAVEARGFVFGAAMAHHLNCGFVPIRKPGKLPYHAFRETYELEYGTDSLEIHRDAVSTGQKVLLIDDLLATGGTALAAVKLIEKCGGQIDTILFLIELGFLNGRQKLQGYNVHALLNY